MNAMDCPFWEIGVAGSRKLPFPKSHKAMLHSFASGRCRNFKVGILS